MARMTLKLPKLAVSMQEGTISELLVEPETTVGVGQPLYTVESEKSAFEVESPFAGKISWLVTAGDKHPVGTPVATIET